MRRHFFPVISITWLLATLALMGLALAADYYRLKKDLTANAHYIYTSVYEKTHINEILLQNFATLISANTTQLPVIRSFAADLRKRYPHIVRLQLQQQQQPLLLLDQEAPADGNRFGFPIIFVEPLSSDTRYLLNNDLQNDPLFAETLMYARKYHQPVASPPFELIDQRSAYGLFLALFNRHSAPDSDNLYIASLIIDTASLLPNASFLIQDASVTLTSERGEILDQRISPDQKAEDQSILPVLTEERTINRFGQSFKLVLTQQTSLHNFSIILLLTILLSSTAVYLLLIAYLKQRLSVEDEHAKVYRKLNDERQKLEQRILTRTQELSDQLEENQRLTHQVLAVQEKERRNLSRELHDELGQSLTAIRTDAKILKRIHPDESSLVNQTAESIDAIAQHIYDVTYGMMRTLRPSALDDLGLMDAIQECIASSRFDAHGITLHSDFRGALNEMSEKYNITLFRLTQEAFSNIIKHAKADNIWIDLHRTDSGQRKDISGDRIELMISDDGIGFDLDSKNVGFGLIGMRERVKALNGSFQVQNNHANGTRVLAIIPIAQAHSAGPEVEAISGQVISAEP